jgi:hypothetical protein
MKRKRHGKSKHTNNEDFDKQIRNSNSGDQKLTAEDQIACKFY